MTRIEQLWQTLAAAGELGGSLRVDATHPCDLYAGLTDDGRPGLQLVTDVPLPVAPRMSAVETMTGRRQDGRWFLSIWLVLPSLRSPFGQLCQDLVDATRGASPDGAGGFLLARLARWRELLEGSRVVSLNELRGLVGELLVLRQCCDKWPAADVVEAWTGPLGAPQDFALPSLLLEAKSTRPGSPTVRITSLDQLDGQPPMQLGVVVLTETTRDGNGFTVSSLVEEIRRSVARESPTALLEFDARLTSTGYRDDDQLAQTQFRCDGVRYFQVRDDFPAIRRTEVRQGVDEASYDILLAACRPFECELGAINGSD
jgi:hypothetical protein